MRFKGIYKDGHTYITDNTKEATKANFKIDSYKEIKNYIHNYLGLTKEEVKNMIWDVVVETVNEEVNKCLNDKARIRTIVEGQVRYEIMKDSPRRTYIHTTMDEIYNKIDQTIHEEVVKRLKIELKNPIEDNAIELSVSELPSIDTGIELANLSDKFIIYNVDNDKYVCVNGIYEKVFIGGNDE
jgi:light-regulated signal transduction histidine kinase (bacteriophytochrome)